MSDHWTQAVIHMKTAIQKNNNYYDFLMHFSPDDDTGYAWTKNTEFKNISEFLGRETDSDGHSGASFACCLRTSIQELKDEMKDQPLIAQPCGEDDSSSYIEGTIVTDSS